MNNSNISEYKIHENTAILRAVKIGSILILFSAFILNFLSIPLWDSDFWWHIATGRDIVSAGSLPEKDPFSYTSVLAENKNPFPKWENFILKQYWLGQITLYLIYDNFSAAGIIILRTFLLIMTLIITSWTLKRYSVSLPISFIFIFMLFSACLKSTGERPVLFTILFTALTLFFLEDSRMKNGKQIFLLIPLMLLWSNIHGGFIIGIIIISIFMFGEGISYLLKKNRIMKRRHFFYSVSLLAIGISLINPTGWDAIYIAANIPFKYKLIHQNIQEYFSPYSIFKEKVAPLQYEYIFLISILPIILLFRHKKMELSHIMLLVIFAVMSIFARRFIIYYVLIGSIILAKETDALIAGLMEQKLSVVKNNKIMNMLVFVTLISATLYLIGMLQRFEKTELKISSSVPTRAVDFIEKNKLSGNMLNDYGYGGYMSWRLYPQKTFIDTRTLNMLVRIEYNWIMQAAEYATEVNQSKSNTPLWERLLNHYKINFIFIQMLDPHAQMYPIIFKLIESDKWMPVYCDLISVIFVRNVEQNRLFIEKFKLSEENVYNTIISQAAIRALSNEVNPRALMSLGEVFYKMGRLEDAIKAYKYAYERMPKSPQIMNRISQIESEIKTRKSVSDDRWENKKAKI